MLILARKIDEKVICTVTVEAARKILESGDPMLIEVFPAEFRRPEGWHMEFPGKVRIAFDAPAEIIVDREEIYKRRLAETETVEEEVAP
jgi:sRNA-binding carbon storage regulator CsrA